MVGRRED